MVEFKPSAMQNLVMNGFDMAKKIMATSKDIADKFLVIFILFMSRS